MKKWQNDYIKSKGVELILDNLGVSDSDKEIAGLVSMLGRDDLRIKNFRLTRDVKIGRSYNIQMQGAVSHEELVGLLLSRGFLNPEVKDIIDAEHVVVQVTCQDIQYSLHFYFDRKVE